MLFKILILILLLFIFPPINPFLPYLSPGLRADDDILKEAGPGKSENVSEPQQQISRAATEPLDHILLLIEKIEDTYDKCELLIKIADAYIELGKPDDSENVLNRAADLAQNKENEIERAVLFSEIIERLISLDKIDAALKNVRYIKFTDSRNDILIKIISGYLRQNQHEKALGLAKEIYEPSFKALALQKITEVLSEQKLYDQLVKAHKVLIQDSFTQSLGRIIVRKKTEINRENPADDIFVSLSRYKKVKALIALAEKQTASGGPSEASESILREATLVSEKIKSKYMKDECLAKIGMGYVKIKRFDTARTIADTIKIPFSRSELLADIAAAYIVIKEFQKACEFIEDIDVGYIKEKLAAQIIIRYIEQGKEEEISWLTAKVNSILSHSRIYAAVAEYYLKKENFRQTFKICEKIENSKIRIKVLLAIATGLQKNGKASQDLRQELLNSLDFLK